MGGGRGEGSAVGSAAVWDRVLGYGGLEPVAIGFIAVVANLGGDPWVTTAVVGLVMVAWLAAVTLRHVRAYPSGRGRGLLISSWAFLGALLVFAVVTSISGEAFDDGVIDGLIGPAAAPPFVVLAVPLLPASLAILRDQ